MPDAPARPEEDPQYILLRDTLNRLVVTSGNPSGSAKRLRRAYGWLYTQYGVFPDPPKGARRVLVRYKRELDRAYAAGQLALPFTDLEPVQTSPPRLLSQHVLDACSLMLPARHRDDVMRELDEASSLWISECERFTRLPLILRILVVIGKAMAVIRIGLGLWLNTIADFLRGIWRAN